MIIFAPARMTLSFGPLLQFAPILPYLFECSHNIVQILPAHKRPHQLMVNQFIEMHPLANRTNPLVIAHVAESMSTLERTSVLSIRDFLLIHRSQVERLHISAYYLHAFCLTKFDRRQFRFDCLHKAVPVHPRCLAVELENVHIKRMLTSGTHFGRLDTRY